MDYTKQVFEMLGLEPNEVFVKTKDPDGSRFKLSPSLEVLYEDKYEGWIKSQATVMDIILGRFEIKKLVTSEECMYFQYEYVGGFGCDVFDHPNYVGYCLKDGTKKQIHSSKCYRCKDWR